MYKLVTLSIPRLTLTTMDFQGTRVPVIKALRFGLNISLREAKDLATDHEECQLTLLITERQLDNLMSERQTWGAQVINVLKVEDYTPPPAIDLRHRCSSVLAG